MKKLKQFKRFIFGWIIFWHFKRLLGKKVYKVYCRELKKRFKSPKDAILNCGANAVDTPIYWRDSEIGWVKWDNLNFQWREMWQERLRFLA